MNKVLILTIYDNLNYGNRFQNYAMQSVLKKFNKETYTLNNPSLYYKKANNKERIKRITFKKLVDRGINIIKTPVKRKKSKVFEKFSNKYIIQDKSSNAEEINKKFNKICIGSDQIWNPYFLNNFYYTFGAFSKNAFSYAASFGIDEIPKEHEEEMKNGLKNLKNISVREEKGAEIVKSLTSQKAEVCVDPTLLLSANEWDEIIKKPEKMPKGKYIFTYFLGKYSKKRKKYIYDFAKENNLEVVNLGRLQYLKYYYIDPSEFLYLLKNSEIVLTDSFHGSVFSIIYKKPFYIFEREENIKSMNSRIETLLNKFDLKERKIKNYSNKISLDCDYSKIDDILEKEKNKSMEFLKNSLEL